MFDNPEEPAEEPVIPENGEADELPEIDTRAIKEAIGNPAPRATAELESFAKQESENYDKRMEAAAHHDDGIPNDLKEMIDQYPIKEFFREEAAKIVLPVFVRRVNQGSIFEEEGAYVPLEKSMLTEGFDLDKQDHNVDFTRADVEVVRVDLAKVGNDEYRPERFNLSTNQLAVIKEHFISLPPEAKKEQLAAAIAKNIRFDEIAEPQIARYIKDAIKDFDSEQIADLYTFEPQTTAAIRNKIGELLGKHQKEVFRKWLDTGQIKCEPRYKLPETMTLRTISKGLSKGLYTEEGDMNDWEYKVINAVAALENVLFWHRNPERGSGFGIKGYTRYNHYPDFIVRLKSGMTILVETKGEQLDNSDSRNKVELGTTWANKAGEWYRYFMVFDKQQMDGAITVGELLDRLKEM